MRGAGDRMTVGERIGFYRARRGLTQTQLANLVGRGPDWLGKIERGERQLRNVEVLVEVARTLRVSLGDLLGEPVLLEEGQHHDDVPAVRDALMAPERLSRMFDRRRVPEQLLDPRRVACLVEFAWDDYQRGRLGRVVGVLPRLIRTAQRLEDAASRQAPDSRRAWAVSARTHHLAATTLAKIGETDLSWMAAERAMRAADHSDDVLVLASAARSATHALLAVGRFDDAVDLGETAVRWLAERAQYDDPAALSLMGMLHLRIAVAAARRQERSVAMEHLTQAARVADRLGADGNHWQTAFGPTNVELHRISVGLDLGDVAWVAGQGSPVSAHGLPVERRVTHLLDLARAFSQLAQDAEALELLLTAERDAPDLVRHDTAVRETVKTIYRRSPVTGGRRSSELLGLAQRCRAVG